MNKHFKEVILSATGADDLYEIGKVQDLWSGYGVIMRYGLAGSQEKTVVVKHVRWPQKDTHPRGWNTDRSHARKIRSYEVETAWYSQWSNRCDDSCYVPTCFAFEKHKGEVLMVLEDLNSAGFDRRRTAASRVDMNMCLAWLANFHATFLGERPRDLWKVGTYWHLGTRPDELKALDDTALKDAARAIDATLKRSPFQTFVHGDAKLANFCFSKKGNAVAAVDFQYVGGGCGMKDVAYFIGSCLYEDECAAREKELLDTYFSALRVALKKRGKDDVSDELEKNWRALYPVAWTDFHRFIKGWSPEHWKINSYSERLARSVLENL